MRVRLRLSDREHVDDLLDFLRRRDCDGDRVDGESDLIEVSPPHTLHEAQAQMELDLLLRVWELVNPGVSVERVS
jgi:hypothetical protein